MKYSSDQRLCSGEHVLETLVLLVGEGERPLGGAQERHLLPHALKQRLAAGSGPPVVRQVIQQLSDPEVMRVTAGVLGSQEVTPGPTVRISSIANE